MLKWSSFDHIDAYNFVSGTITTTETPIDDNPQWVDKRNKWIIFKSCVPFNDCINEIILR